MLTLSPLCDPTLTTSTGVEDSAPVSPGAGWLPGHHLGICGILDSMGKGPSSWPSTCSLQSDPENSVALGTSGIQILPASPGSTHITAIFKHLHLTVPLSLPTQLFILLCVDGTDILLGCLDRNPGPTPLPLLHPTGLLCPPALPTVLCV